MRKIKQQHYLKKSNNRRISSALFDFERKILLKSDTRDINNKIELLCYGLRTNETVDHIYNLQNPYDLTRTGNVGLQLKVGNSRLIANVPVFNKFTSQSPYSIETDCNNNYFVKNLITEECFSVEVVQSPQWYLDMISNGNHVGQYILREGADTLICSITKSCGYVYHNQQCRFCAISANSTHNTSKNEDERYDSLPIQKMNQSFYLMSQSYICILMPQQIR